MLKHLLRDQPNRCHRHVANERQFTISRTANPWAARTIELAIAAYRA